MVLGLIFSTLTHFESFFFFLVYSIQLRFQILSYVGVYPVSPAPFTA